MTQINRNCSHEGLPEGCDYQEKCPGCGITSDELYHNPGYIHPHQKVSQQPHGDQTMYCNACQMYVKPTMWDGEEVCPYHQYSRMTEDGPTRMYEEFNDDGEEW